MRLPLCGFILCAISWKKRDEKRGWRTLLNGMSSQWPLQKETEAGSEILQVADRQTDWVGGPWAHLQCRLLCISATAILQGRDREGTSIDESLLSIHPLFICELDLGWMEKRNEGGGVGGGVWIATAMVLEKVEEFRWRRAPSRKGIYRVWAFWGQFTTFWEDEISTGENSVLAKENKDIWFLEKK